MKINWKLRFKNKATLLALITCICTFSYQLLGVLGVMAPVSEDMMIQFVGMVLNVLVAMGVLVDPTTAGLRDSYQACSYDKPRESR
ncbi:MAG: phage holin [Anaerovorax sp.]